MNLTDGKHVMTPAEQSAYAEAAGGAEPVLVLRSRTKVDTGRWLRKSRLWLCVTGDALVLVAASKRRYAESVALAGCARTHYNHVSGVLVIEPGEDLRFNQVALPPTRALRVIHLVEQANHAGGRASSPMIEQEPTQTEPQSQPQPQPQANATENNGA